MAWASGCGPDDSALVDCRCTDDTDTSLFPQCQDALLDQEGPSGGILGTRIPECPGSRSLSLLEPTRPLFVLLNIRTTLEGYSPIQYMDQLSEDFFFVPDERDLALYAEVYQPPAGYDPQRDTLWTPEDERRFIVNLLDRTRFKSIEFKRWYESGIDERRVSEDGLTETYDFLYEISLVEQPVEGAEAGSIEVKGRMEVDLITPTLENPVWTLTDWRDFGDQLPSKTSWTELRGDFSQ